MEKALGGKVTTQYVENVPEGADAERVIREMAKRGDKVVWKCRNCGFIHEGTVAPNMCPACQHPQAHFEIKESNY